MRVGFAVGSAMAVGVAAVVSCGAIRVTTDVAIGRLRTSTEVGCGTGELVGVAVGAMLTTRRTAGAGSNWADPSVAPAVIAKPAASRTSSCLIGVS